MVEPNEIAALEAELIEQAKANGAGAEREAALAAENAAMREKMARCSRRLSPRKGTR